MFSMSITRASARAGADASNAPYHCGSKLKSLAILVTAAFACGTAAHAADLPGTFRGNAYATYANVKAGPIAATLASSAFERCACEGTNGQVLSNEVDGLSAGLNGNDLTGTKTIATVYTAKTATTANVQNTSTISGMAALAGLISADSINAVANVSANSRTMTASSDGSGFQNLVIAGQHIPDNVAPNTTVPLPGVGTATLNKITTAGNMRGGASILVEMITIDVTARNNTLGLPAGTKMVVGHAYAQFFRKVPEAVYDGQAYAVQASGSADLRNKVGTSANLVIDCVGTGGTTKTNSTAGTDVGVISTGDGETTAFAGPEGGADVARTTATVSNTNLLGGLITANAIQAVAQSTLQNGVATGSADGSGFSGLTVAGVTIPTTMPPNTKLTLPLLGYVVVNEQTIGQDGSAAANGLHIHVSKANLLGLPVGTDLVVAHATASAAPF